jgi:phenylacetate-CoA ligase
LLHENIPLRKLRVHHTSGSSGTPVATYWLPREYRQAVALREVRSCGYAGVSYDLPRATFSGRLVVPDPLSPGPFHRYNYFERQVYFSAFHLSGKTVQQYVAALNRHNIRWITGYTHAMYQLASLMLEQGLSAPSVSALITTSEPLTAEKRQTMESAFQAKVFEEYGCVENVLFASECEQGGLHISPEAGIIEIVDEHMRPVAPGTPGEVLATGLLRESQPFIRYRLGDWAILAKTPCPCGRRLPRLESVVGRMEDLVYGPDGRRVGKFHGLFVNQPHISEGQVIQESLQLIRIRVVAKPGFCEQDRTELIRRLHQRLSDQVQVQVELVDHIEKTAAGKFRAVISKITAPPR